MKRVLVFGIVVDGQSRLARRLAAVTGLPLYVSDKIQFREGGTAVSKEEFLAAHADLLRTDEWIIDGYGSTALTWERCARADTLVYIDLPLAVHHWWVTKRLIGGLFVTPTGWPKGTPVWSSSMLSYKVLWLCHRQLTPKYRQFVADMSAMKRVHHLRSGKEIRVFLDGVGKEQS